MSKERPTIIGKTICGAYQGSNDEYVWVVFTDGSAMEIYGDLTVKFIDTDDETYNCSNKRGNKYEII